MSEIERRALMKGAALSALAFTADGRSLASGGVVCLDAFTQAHVKDNHASTSADDVFGDFTIC